MGFKKLFSVFEKESFEEERVKREAVMALFKDPRPDLDFSIEELELMREYLESVQDTTMWTGSDFKQERLLRRALSLILLANREAK